MKLVMGCCATLLAFVLIAPAASAGPRRDTTPPTVPTGLRLVSATENSLTLAWNASTDNSGSIHHYVVSPGSWHPGDSTQKTISWLVPSYTQTYRVSAADAAGNESAPSAPLTATTAPDLTAPTTPANLRLTGSTPSSVTLAWDRSTDRWGLGYQILMNGQVIAQAASTSTQIRKLPQPGTYTLTVRARDQSGNLSGLSNALTVTLADTGDHTGPTAPSNLTAESLEDFCGSVRLNWGQSTDNVDPQSSIEYELYRNGVFHDLVTGAGGAWVYAGPGTSTWHVVAVDRSGNSSVPSNTVSVTTNADENLC